MRVRYSLRLTILVLTVFCGTCGHASQAMAARRKTPEPVEMSVADADQAEALVQRLGDRAIAILADKSYDAAARSEQFRTMLRDSFDLTTIGRFVLGRNAWNGATPEQQQEYMRLFEKLVIKIYSDRFAMYSGQKFKAVTSRPEGERDVVVKSQVIQPNDDQHAIEVDWRVRNVDGHLGIIDVIVEGISMSVTQRQEYGAVIQRNDGTIDELLKLMRDQLEKQDAEGQKQSDASAQTAH